MVTAMSIAALVQHWLFSLFGLIFYSITNADVLEISACSHCDGVLIAQSLIARSHKKRMGHSEVKHHSRHNFANSTGEVDSNSRTF
jgi:hypothetical protein